jgi:chloramphenicol-sensitive protein RarD
LALAALLGLYGSLRKSIKYDPLIAVTGEVLILQPFALAYIAYLGFSNGAAGSTMSLGVGVLVMLIGPITVIPMIWFALAAHRLTLATLGFLSYITPSLLFIIAVAVFRERIDHDLLIGFIMVWMALIVYSVDTSRTLRDRRPAACRGVAT